jgi:hypothetical protein
MAANTERQDMVTIQVPEIPAMVAFDAIQANAHMIPRNAFAVGGYVNGANQSFIWSQASWDLFPDAYHIRINVTGDVTRGNALDVEAGDATPASVAPWIASRGPATKDPLLVYCNRSNLVACVSARDAAHKSSGHYAYIWCATLDGSLSGRAMTQVWQLRSGGTAVADVSLITSGPLASKMLTRIGQQA